MFFCEVAFVFALEVDAPADGVVEAFARGEEDIYSFGVGAAYKGCCGDEFEAFAESFIDELAEEVKVSAFVCKDVFDEILDEGFGEVHVSVKVAEGYFWLDHPEFGCMACGVGVFRTECGAKGVDVAEGAGVGFCLKLSADGEVGGLFKEVFFVGCVALLWV